MIEGRPLLVDTHCHLTLRQFDQDREAVIERAAAAGVQTIVVPAIDVRSCKDVLGLAESHPGVYAAVGVHPNDSGDFAGETVLALRDFARHPKVVAIGEIGLDYYWERVDHEQQKRALRAQLALAAEARLPVILHARDAQKGPGGCTGDLLCEIAQWVPEIRSQYGPDGILGVWHAFSGDLAQAVQAYDSRLVLGLGGPITFENARALHVLLPQLRMDRLLLETDAPYLAPHPHRGKRNEPAYVPLIAEGVARRAGWPVAAVAKQTSATAQSCFGFG